MKVLFICPYPLGQAPSQRFRFEQYFDFLESQGITYRTAPFLDAATWAILYRKGFVLQKVWGIVKGFWRRLGLFFTLHRYDTVFVHREASPLGWPWVEWAICKIWRKKMIFDFDDAIWLPNTSQENRLAAWLKFHQKTALLCRWAHRISAGNAYLAEYARQYKQDVRINPTTIDTEALHQPALLPPKIPQEKIIIGWTGSHSTIQYLDFLVPILQKLEGKYCFEFRVISNRPPAIKLASLHYVPWRKESEIADLAQIDIGLMPLSDDAWAKGKCGFKALQYMALEIPAVASPVGVNSDIIQQKVNGLLCQSPEEWYEALAYLLEQPEARQAMGKKARTHIEAHYSVQSNQNNFLLLLL